MIEAYNSSIDNLNENLAQQTMLTALQGNELPKTEEDFNKFKQAYIGFLNKGGRKMSRMKFYLSTKDKKLSMQKDIIEKLQDENKCLKEQLKLYNVEKYKEKMKELDECYKRYSELSKELEGYKSEYLHLLSDMKRGV